MSDAPELSIVLPAYNAASYIDTNVGRVLDWFARSGTAAELIVADDGSTDGTADAIRVAPNVRVLRLAHRGKGSAVRQGMAAATGEISAFTDCDLPYGLDVIALAARWITERRYHAVIGDRTLPGSEFVRPGPVRAVLSGLGSFVFRTLVTGGIYDTQCGLKVFRGDVAREVFGLCRINAFAIDVELVYLLLKYRLDIKRIPVHLESSSPSSVRPVRDALVATRDVGLIRANWAMGRYRSQALEEILAADVLADR